MRGPLDYARVIQDRVTGPGKRALDDRPVLEYGNTGGTGATAVPASTLDRKGSIVYKGQLDGEEGRVFVSTGDSYGTRSNAITFSFENQAHEDCAPRWVQFVARRVTFTDKDGNLSYPAMKEIYTSTGFRPITPAGENPIWNADTRSNKDPSYTTIELLPKGKAGLAMWDRPDFPTIDAQDIYTRFGAAKQPPPKITLNRIFKTCLFLHSSPVWKAEWICDASCTYDEKRGWEDSSGVYTLFKGRTGNTSKLDGDVQTVLDTEYKDFKF